MKIKYTVTPDGYVGSGTKQVDACSFENAAEEFAHWHDGLAANKTDVDNHHLVTVTDKHGISKKFKVTGRIVRTYQTEALGAEA